MPFGIPQWGIFNQDGTPVLLADTVVSVDYHNTYRISDYPIEEGAFASYNKVKVPYSAKVAFATSGALFDRAGFLQTLEQALASLNLFVIVTPEISYDNANIIDFNYRRSARNGAQLIRVEVFVEEVRIVQSGRLSNTQSANGDVQQQNGAVQLQPTGPNNSANLKTNLTSSDISTSTSPTAIPSTSPIGPAFYNANSLPEVPNTYNLLTGPQQQTALTTGLNTTGASNVLAYPPDIQGRSYLVIDNANAGLGGLQ